MDHEDTGARKVVVRLHTRGSNAAAAVFYGAVGVVLALLVVPGPWGVVLAGLSLVGALAWGAVWPSLDDLWLEGDELHERTRRTTVVLRLVEVDAIRYVSGFRADSTVVLASGTSSIRIPVNDMTRELRVAAGRRLAAARPGRVFGDVRAMRALAVGMH